MVNPLKFPPRYPRYTAAIIVIAFSSALSISAAQSYSASGLIVKVIRESNKVMVSMREIPGYMDDTEMTLPVTSSQELSGLSPGLMVNFKLIIDGKSARAEDFHVRPYMNFDFDPQTAARLEVLKKVVPNGPASTAQIEIGQQVRDFSLIDQNSRRVALSQFLGKVVAMTFAYTSCPFPNYCFRLSNNFGQLQKRFDKRMGEDLILLSVTLDPGLDQPATLAKYASIWKANGRWWRFLTGPPAEIERIKEMFGVVSSPNMEMLSHSLHTVIIDRQGVLTENIEGNEFTSRQLGDLVEVELNRVTVSKSE